MSELKIATFNAEWMVSIFGGRWRDWISPTIPDKFPGRKLGDIQLEPIDDVPGLCDRIAGVIKDVGAQIIGIVEAPPLKEQMEVFVKRFLAGEYVVHYSNSRWQSISALVHRSISDQVTAFAPDGPEIQTLRARSAYYPWGGIAKNERKLREFYRTPLVLNFRPEPSKALSVVVVHTKSKFSKLKTREQWDKRDREAILDALNAREELSAEMMCLRKYLDEQLAPPNENSAMAIMGDMNDGPFAELMETEFLIHNIVDELVGTLLQPMRHFRHAMTPDVLATAATTRFPDPLEDGAIVEELIDHILISPGIWQRKAGFKLKTGSCTVETKAYEKHNDDNGATPRRGLRPSDHKPVSAVFTY